MRRNLFAKLLYGVLPVLGLCAQTSCTPPRVSSTVYLTWKIVDASQPNPLTAPFQAETSSGERSPESAFRTCDFAVICDSGWLRPDARARNVWSCCSCAEDSANHG